MARELVTFDCYGTLVDWKSGICRALRERFPRTRRWEDGELLQAYVREEARVEEEAAEEGFRPYREVLWEAVRRLAARHNWALSRGDRGFLAESLPSWPSFPDTNPALERLAAGGARLGIVSNVDDDLLAGSLKALSVEFDVLVTAERVRSYKPAVPHFRRAVEEAGGSPDSLVHVAQSWFHDVRPARRLGLTVVWVNREAEERPTGPGEPSPTAEVPDLAAAADWLLSREN